MKLTYGIIVTCAAALLATGCTGSKSETPSRTISFENLTGRYSYRLLQSARDFDRDSDILCFDSVSLMYPTLVLDCNIKELQDSILSAAFDTVAPPDSAMRHCFAARSAELGYATAPAAGTSDEEETADGFMLISGSVVNLSGDWLTYCVSTGISEPGAAHGLTVNRYLNFSITEGRLVTLAGLFTPEGMDKLPGIIANQANRMRSLLGPTSIDGLPSAGNFIITPEGTIEFAYQPYEVASYAQGEIRVPFYPYQLSEFMTPAGLKLFRLAAD